MEVSDQIIKVLDKVSEKFGIVVDWSSKNILPYIQQLGDRIVKYDLYKSIFWLVLCVIAIIASSSLIKLICKGYKNTKINNEENIFFEDICGPSPTFTTIILVVFIIFLLVFIIVGFITNVNNIIQDILLPEKTIVEFIKPYLN